MTNSKRTLPIGPVTLLAEVPREDNSKTFNATALASFLTQITSGLGLENLDHLIKVAVDTNLQTTVADNSVLGYLLSKSAISDFDRTKHSLQELGRILEILNDHFHSVQFSYPSGAVPATLTSGGGAWTWGNYTEIIAASVISNIFDLHWADISAPSANENYEIEISYGAGDTVAAIIPFTRTNVFTNSISKGLMTPLIPADSRVRARMRDGSGGATAGLKVSGHEY